MAIAAAMLSSCGNSTPKASLKSDVDSMSYAIGVGQAQGLKEYLVYRMGVDTTYMDEFVKGLNEGASAGDDKKKAAYYAGRLASRYQPSWLRASTTRCLATTPPRPSP